MSDELPEISAGRVRDPEADVPFELAARAIDAEARAVAELEGRLDRVRELCDKWERLAEAELDDEFAEAAVCEFVGEIRAVLQD